MYTPKHFEENDPQVLHGLMRNFSFALLSRLALRSSLLSRA